MRSMTSQKPTFVVTTLIDNHRKTNVFCLSTIVYISSVVIVL